MYFNKFFVLIVSAAVTNKLIDYYLKIHLFLHQKK